MYNTTCFRAINNSGRLYYLFANSGTENHCAKKRSCGRNKICLTACHHHPPPPILSATRFLIIERKKIVGYFEHITWLILFLVTHLCCTCKTVLSLWWGIMVLSLFSCSELCSVRQSLGVQWWSNIMVYKKTTRKL